MARGKRRDPIAEYVEWTQHRYDPGYYLGGNLPPYFRKAALGPRARRRAGALLGVMALGALVSALPVFAIGSRWERLGMAAVVLLIAAAAVSMYRSGCGRPADHGRSAGRNDNDE